MHFQPQKQADFSITKKQSHLCNCLIIRERKLLDNKGAENEIRTRDPQLGKLMLYQLSYFRIFLRKNLRKRTSCPETGMQIYANSVYHAIIRETLSISLHEYPQEVSLIADPSDTQSFLMPVLSKNRQGYANYGFNDYFCDTAYLLPPQATKEMTRKTKRSLRHHGKRKRDEGDKGEQKTGNNLRCIWKE